METVPGTRCVDHLPEMSDPLTEVQDQGWVLDLGHDLSSSTTYSIFLFER